MKQASRKAKPNHAGVMRNDLPGYMKLRGNKIYIRYKGRDISTGYDNTAFGWKAANIFWEKRSKELKAIETGEKAHADNILNIFKKFLEYKRKITKINPMSERFYINSFNRVISNPKEMLTEENIKKQLTHYVETTTASTSTININLRGINVFLNWACDEENNYIPFKNYTKKLKQRQSKKVKPAYTEEEYNLLVSHFEKRGKAEMCLLLRFLWHTGARVGETLNIKLSDLDLQNNRIFIQNKIYKGLQETLLLIPEAVMVVERAVELADVRGDGKLFSWEDTSQPNDLVRRAEARIGIKKAGRGLHGLRRTFSDRLFEMDLSIPDVKDIMRHKNIKTTDDHYRSFREKELIEKMSRKKGVAP